MGLECKQNFRQLQMTKLYKIVMLKINKKQYDEQKFAQFSITVSRILFVLYRVFEKFVPILYCILRKAFNASLGKCTLI